PIYIYSFLMKMDSPPHSPNNVFNFPAVKEEFEEEPEEERSTNMDSPPHPLNNVFNFPAVEEEFEEEPEEERSTNVIDVLTIYGSTPPPGPQDPSHDS
nr:hypothetical protein [Tanacetum cinerariifolium]